MSEIIDIARSVFKIEIEELAKLEAKIDHHFSEAVKCIHSSKGRVIVTGMGKSGIIGQKFSSSLSSTGTKSFFIHPAEAVHGDLGAVHEEDIIVAISNSGETDELLRIIPLLINKNKIISLTGNLASTLAKNSDFTISTFVDKEACPLDIAPTCSTTAALVVCDAITVALMKLNNFSKKSFSRFHPGGNLGKKLITKISDVMRNDNLPFVRINDSVENLLIKMSDGKSGIALIGSPDNLIGVITDGDLRRGLLKFNGPLKNLKISNFLTDDPVIVNVDDSVNDVEELMLKKKISTILVKDLDNIVGTYQIFD